MTTYPLSEPATIFDAATSDSARTKPVGRGSLEECIDIIAALPTDRQDHVSIRMDELALDFGPKDIAELRRFLAAEAPGLSNTEITDIKTSEA